MTLGGCMLTNIPFIHPPIHPSLHPSILGPPSSSSTAITNFPSSWNLSHRTVNTINISCTHIPLTFTCNEKPHTHTPPTHHRITHTTELTLGSRLLVSPLPSCPFAFLCVCFASSMSAHTIKTNCLDMTSQEFATHALVFFLNLKNGEAQLRKPHEAEPFFFGPMRLYRMCLFVLQFVFTHFI